MENIICENDLTTKILVEYIKQGLSNEQIFSELIERCEFNVNKREVYASLNFLRK